MKITKLISLFVIGACFVFVHLISVSSIGAQEKYVEDLEMRSYRSVTREEILKNVKTRAGEVYKEAQVREDFQRIMEMGIFDRAQSRFIVKDGRRGIIVIFVLKEIPKEK